MKDRSTWKNDCWILRLALFDSPMPYQPRRLEDTLPDKFCAVVRRPWRSTGKLKQPSHAKTSFTKCVSDSRSYAKHIVD